jgi:hypothetical protein
MSMPCACTNIHQRRNMCVVHTLLLERFTLTLHRSAMPASGVFIPSFDGGRTDDEFARATVAQCVSVVVEAKYRLSRLSLVGHCSLLLGSVGSANVRRFNESSVVSLSDWCAKRFCTIHAIFTCAGINGVSKAMIANFYYY